MLGQCFMMGNDVYMVMILVFLSGDGYFDVTLKMKIKHDVHKYIVDGF